MASQLNAERDLFAACREWRRLAEAEGHAIRTRNWEFCAACQASLQQLRDRMSALMPAARDEWRQAGDDCAARMQAFDETLHQLITLERRNHTLVKTLREAAQAKIQQLNQTRLKLKHLRQAYGFARGPMVNAYLGSGSNRGQLA